MERPDLSNGSRRKVWTKLTEYYTFSKGDGNFVFNQVLAQLNPEATADDKYILTGKKRFFFASPGRREANGCKRHSLR
jgi:hypothetical protein